MIRMPNLSAAGITYAAPSAVERPEWITSRQKSRVIWEGGNSTGYISDQAEEAAAPLQTEDIADEAQPERMDSMNAEHPAEYGLRAYGCAYQSTAQRLAISRPKDCAMVRFGGHSCLKRVEYAQDGSGLLVQEAGDYEIVFEMCAAVKAASPVTFALAVGEEAIPGGTITVILPGGMRQYRSGVMAPLRAGARVGVVLTSASVCEVEFAPNGARLMIKKLD